MQLLSPWLQLQLSSVSTVPLSWGAQSTTESADSTARREEAKRTRRGTSILVVEDSPPQWGLLQASVLLKVEQQNRISPISSRYWCIQAVQVSKQIEPSHHIESLTSCSPLKTSKLQVLALLKQLFTSTLIFLPPTSPSEWMTHPEELRRQSK